MKILRRTVFGNPILRSQAKHLEINEILSASIEELIANMFHTLIIRQYGVGLAAPQVGRDAALSVIGIKPTPSRPNSRTINMVIINPQIIKTYGKLVPKWEGCISLGSGEDLPYAQAMRFEKIRLRYQDRAAKIHEADFDGLLAHVMQHEVDHLAGILFVDRVIDSKTFVSVSEYKKRYLKKPEN